MTDGDERVHKRTKEKEEVGGVKIVQVIDSLVGVKNRDSQGSTSAKEADLLPEAGFTRCTCLPCLLLLLSFFSSFSTNWVTVSVISKIYESLLSLWYGEPLIS